MSYRSPWWLRGGHLQTIYPALRPAPRVRFTRERWETPDGDFVDVDWAGPAQASRLLVVFHGLEGSSTSHYTSAIAAHATMTGWRCAVPHFRGCSGEPNRLPRAYHSGDSDEIDWMLRRFATRGVRVCAIGVSLGGNALLKWLGEQAEAARELVVRAASVSAPLDLTAAGNALDQGVNRLIYARMFLGTLRRKAIAKLAKYPRLFDAQAVQDARSLRAFDDLVTAPLHGYAGTDDYWRRASSKPWLAKIALPTLVLNARNDPFLPAASLPDSRAVARDVVLDFPDEGGHAGFVSGAFPGDRRWLTEHLLGFLSTP
ncbi:MAG: alpha/beta fold hydrolase [Betaproteobacteria bacterium]|nr:alpha/beta fold hydrolase [Betaproteobacteria bacterium]